MPATREQIQAIFDVMLAITEVIRAAGEIPSGVLYARLMDKIDIHTYNAILSRIKGSGLVVEKNHLLTWVGPKL
jgi:hypothetical protein